MSPSKENPTFFIERPEATKIFDDLLRTQSKSRYVLYINAMGGYGKTAELNHYVDICRNNGWYLDARNEPETSPLIDFQETSNRNLLGLWESISARLGKEFFLVFNKELLNLMRDKPDTENPLQISHRRNVARQFELQSIFLKDMENIPPDRRAKTALFFDTFELVQRGGVGNWFLNQFLPHATSLGYLVVFAGRPYIKINPISDITIKSCKLGNFTEQEASKYWQFLYTKNPDFLRVEDSGETEIVKLAGGVPLLLTIYFHLIRLNNSTETKRKISLHDWVKQLGEDNRRQALENWMIQKFLELHEDALGYIFLEIALLRYRYTHNIYKILDQGFYNDYEEFLLELDRLITDGLLYIKRYGDGHFLRWHDEFQHMLWQADLDGRWARQRNLKFYNAFKKVVNEWYPIEIERASDAFEKEQLRVEYLAYILNLPNAIGFDNPIDIRGEQDTIVSPDYERASGLLNSYEALNSSTLDELLVELIQPKAISSFPKQYQYQIYELMGKIAARVYRLDQAQEFWMGCVESSDNPRQKVIALIAQHNVTWQANPEKSLDEILPEALSICNANVDLKLERARVTYEFGFTHHKFLEFDLAIEKYEEALDIAFNIRDDELCATIMNDMGKAYLERGDGGPARTFIMEGLQTRKQVLEEIQKEKSGLSPTNELYKRSSQRERRAVWMLGASYMTLGDLNRYIGDLAEASIEYSAAEKIFREEGFANAQAVALYNRAETHRRIARDAYSRGREYAERAISDISNSLTIIQDNGFYTISDTAYRRQGRIFHDQGFWAQSLDETLALYDKSEASARKGLEISRITNDVQEELECFRDLAFLADDRVRDLQKFGAPKAIIQLAIDNGVSVINEFANTIAKHSSDSHSAVNISVFNYLEKMERGAFAQAQGPEHYSEALSLYLVALSGLASLPGYGVYNYHLYQEHVIDIIRSLDTNTQKMWIEQFLLEWKQKSTLDSKQSLEVAHPGLPRRLNLILRKIT